MQIELERSVFEAVANEKLTNKTPAADRRLKRRRRLTVEGVGLTTRVGFTLPQRHKEP